MYRNSANTTATQASETPIAPRSCSLITTPPTSKTRSGNGLWKNFSSGPQIQPAAPLKIPRSAIVTSTTVSSERWEKGRIAAWCTAAPPRNASASVIVKASQYVSPRLLISDHAM